MGKGFVRSNTVEYKLLKGVPILWGDNQNPTFVIADVLSLIFERSYVMEKMFKLLIPLDFYLRTLLSGHIPDLISYAC